MNLTRRHKIAGAAVAAGLAGATALTFAVPALAGASTLIPINGGNVPTTAEGFETQSCDQIPGDTADWLDGWVFVLPDSVKAEGNFEYIEAVFQDEDGNVLRYDTADDGGIVSGSGNNKAYIITPAGLTLVDAEARVMLEEDDGKGKPKFNLTHACPATEEPPGEETPTEEPSSPTEEPSSPTEEPSSPTEEPSSPTEEPSSPNEEPSSPTEEPSSPAESSSAAPSSEAPSSAAPSSAAPSSSAPGQASTSPAGSALPTTGSSLTYVLAGAGALLVAGIVLLVLMRRRAEGTEGA